ncbi:hypothetical protein KDA08_00700 [Candidatus Saccharibacteria bacterium]|nr:hypothetical protein [Candidatus Saccharibacteria bacterium]MCA9312826.1 hypothetical protein [Candidatus Saccharibacteria bacterium]
MKFVGKKRVIAVDANYSQITKLEKFWNEMRDQFPDDFLYGLGANMNSKSIDYYIGKIDEQWQGGIEFIDIPDDGWEEFSCKEDDAEIERLYRDIFKQRTPDYELESIKNGIFTTKVHFPNMDSER